MTTAASTIIDLSPYIQDALGLLSTVVLALGGVAIHALNQWLSAKTGHQNLINEDTIRGYLNTGIENATHYAVSKIGTADWAHVDTKNALVAAAADYALAHVPDALAYFKIDQATLEATLEAKFAKLFPLPVAAAPVAPAAGA